MLTSWVLVAAAAVMTVIGLVSHRRRRRGDDDQTGAILSFVVSADLVVLAVGLALR